MLIGTMHSLVARISKCGWTITKHSLFGGFFWGFPLRSKIRETQNKALLSVERKWSAPRTLFGYGSKVWQNEVVLMWHHYHVKSRMSTLKVGSILSPQVRSIMRCFGPQITYTRTLIVNSPFTPNERRLCGDIERGWCRTMKPTNYGCNITKIYVKK